MKKIEAYEVVSELGRGGMGVVYKVFDPGLSRHVAIKMLAETISKDQTQVQRFVREARSVATLNHPNIVQVYSIGQQDDSRYFVMEYVKGSTLSQLLEAESHLPPKRAVHLLKQAAAGLEAAHGEGIVHRDIKPGNILLDEKGVVKIADFGIARAPELGNKLTATGQFLGTPGYISPEVCQGEELDQRADIFSLGIVFFEMLAGRLPFREESPLALLKEVVSSEIPDIRQINDQVDTQLQAILAKMLAKKKEDRYLHCGQLISDLNHYLALDPEVHDQPSPLGTVPALIARKRARLFFPTAALLILVPAGMFFRSQLSGEDSANHSGKEPAQSEVAGGLLDTTPTAVLGYQADSAVLEHQTDSAPAGAIKPPTGGGTGPSTVTPQGALTSEPGGTLSQEASGSSGPGTLIAENLAIDEISAENNSMLLTDEMNNGAAHEDVLDSETDGFIEPFTSEGATSRVDTSALDAAQTSDRLAVFTCSDQIAAPLGSFLMEVFPDDTHLLPFRQPGSGESLEVALVAEQLRRNGGESLFFTEATNIGLEHVNAHGVSTDVYYDLIKLRVYLPQLEMSLPAIPVLLEYSEYDTTVKQSMELLEDDLKQVVRDLASRTFEQNKRPRVAVIGVGEPLPTLPLEGFLEYTLAKADYALFDEVFYPKLASLSEKSVSAEGLAKFEEAGADIVILVDVSFLNEKKQTGYGQTSLVTKSAVQVVFYKTSGSQLGFWNRNMTYTLNEGLEPAREIVPEIVEKFLELVGD